MTSRGASQPASILKPTAQGSRSQGSRGQTQGSRGLTRGSGYTEDGSVGTRGETRATTTKPTSLFDAVKLSQRQDDGEGVKADDIWNKFVSDDQDVVRAPTAETNVSGTEDELSEGSGSEGSEHPSQEEEEEEEEESSDDDRTIYSDYYLPPEYQRPEGTPGPRAEIVDSHEACSCFPNRSHKFVGSMLYDKVGCIHTGLTGHTQPGVFKFNPYWNESMEEPRRLRKRDMRIAKSKYVFGYPRPRFEIVSDSEEDEYDEDGDEEEEEGSEKDGSQAKPMTSSIFGKFFGTPRTAKTRDSEDEDEDDSEYDSEDYDDDGDDEEDEDYMPFQLPQIGYPVTPSLPPSSQQSFRSRYSDFTESYVTELPSLPQSRQLTAQTKRTGVTQRTQRTQFTLPSQQREGTKRSTKTAKTSKTPKSKGKSGKKAGSNDSGYDDENKSRRSLESRQSLPTGPVVSTARTFQGKFYDPVTKQVMLYDIGTNPGKRLPAGNIEPLYKPPTAQTDKKQTPRSGTKDGAGGSKPGTTDSKRSKGSHQSEPKAAVLGAVFISNLLSKNKKNKDAFEAGYSDEDIAN